jgi:hypothetical protein
VRVGDVGVARTPLRPAGSAEFEGAWVDVVSGLGFIDAGERVRVAKVLRFSTVVERAEAESSADRSPTEPSPGDSEPNDEPGQGDVNGEGREA